MTILIKGAELNGERTDILIDGKWIKEIGQDLPFQADKVIDGQHKAVIPGLINTHTHAAMTLLRGFGDDMPLQPWLMEKIWPQEAKLTEEDVYWGAKLACLEMIKTGTTAFHDMYFNLEATSAAVEEMGIRAALGFNFFDHGNPELREKAKRENRDFFSQERNYSDRITYTLAPHSIYTVSGELWQWLHAFAQDMDLAIHTHVAETELEVVNALEQLGDTPVRYLYKLGVLSPRMTIAHGLYVDDEEIRMLADHGVKVAHNPASNMKLASGIEFKFKEMREAGVIVGIGTDGCASSNNLDMIEAMKLASLLGKAWRKDPEALPVADILSAATEEGAKIVGWKTGHVAEGYLADLCLVDLKLPAFTPNFNFFSNLIYAANGSCVDTVICDGRILMQHGTVPGEEEILQKSAESAYNLVKREK
ncbi:MAG: amidohydrolase [Tannerellaceae bacterium]|nr:amidohydrolase [Tannerellaceae bacterium]